MCFSLEILVHLLVINNLVQKKRDFCLFLLITLKLMEQSECLNGMICRGIKYLQNERSNVAIG